MMRTPVGQGIELDKFHAPRAIRFGRRWSGPPRRYTFRSAERRAGAAAAAAQRPYVMQRSEDSFHLIDLASQAEAVQALLDGRSKDEKVAWFERHGKLTPTSAHFGSDPPVYQFESSVGLQCVFFLKGESLVFIGDNTTWSVPRPPAALHNQTFQRTGAAGVVARLRKWLTRGSGR